MGDIAESIKVFVRQRPVLGEQTSNTTKSNEKHSGITSISEDAKKCSYFTSVNNSVQDFNADQFFVDSSTQSDLYDKIAAPLVSSALLGYSGTIFAYGPTSSGKTFTMRGGEGDLRGVMPRCIEHLLSNVKSNESGEVNNKVSLWASYVQIYCEGVTDLLTSSSIEQLSIREKNGTVYVEGLSRVQIVSIEDLWELLARGDENRKTASTNMNETSSRSHAALMINVLVQDDEDERSSKSAGTHKESTLMLVDLAGSERATASEGRDYMRLEEAKAINLSLSALGNCMSALAEGRAHIPYRDSKLTRLLQGCLGGASRTAVIVNVPPGEDPTGETLSALRFASRASKIKVVAKVRRCKDFEAMYLEARKTLEALERSGGGTASEAQKKKDKELQEDQLRQKDSTIEQQRIEIAALKAQLLLLQHTADAIGSGSIDKSNDSSAGVTKSVDWSSKLSALSEQHTSELLKVNKMHQLKYDQCKHSERQLSAEVSSLHDELNNDRQALLTSMQDLRILGEKKARVESALQSRVEELLEEVVEKRELIETLQNGTTNLKIRLEESERQIGELSAKMGEMVSREQVREMEGLFVDTVTKLSARVNFLETQPSKPSSSQPPSVQQQAPPQQYQNSNNNNSRIKIEPGGKIRAVSLTPGGNQYSAGIAATAGLPHSSSNDTILSNKSNSSGGSGPIGRISSNNGTDASKNKLW